jgi:hypothetical protein
MDVVIRLLLRLILVPFGAGIAIAVAIAIVVAGHWNVRSDDRPFDIPFGVHFFYFAVVFAKVVHSLPQSIFASCVFVAAAIGVLISEAFAVRSWIFHTANGGLSTLIAWAVTQDMRHDPIPGEPSIVLAAGLGAGLAYWIVAGWTAGFWKPIRASHQPALPPS